MNTSIQSADLTFFRAHLPMYCFLLFALPPLSLLVIKFLLSAKSAKHEKAAKEWHVSPEIDANGDPFFFDPDADNFDSREPVIYKIGSQIMTGCAVKSARNRFEEWSSLEEVN